MSEKISSWKDSDIAALILSLEPLLNTPDGAIDATQMQQALDEHLGTIYDRWQQLAASPAAQKFAADTDPHALADIMDAYKDITQDTRRTLTFVQLGGLHYSGRGVDAPIQAVLGKVGQLSQMLQSLYTSSLAPLAKLNDEQFDAFIKAEPRLEPYLPALKKMRSAPSGMFEATSEQNNDELQRVIEISPGLTDMSKTPEERNEVLARYATGIMLIKQKTCKKQGFQHTKDVFAYVNEAPLDMIDAFNAQAGEHTQAYTDACIKLQPLFYSKVSCKQRFSFDEARDILVSAYSELSPEIGHIVERAFDEQWINVEKHAHPHVISVPAASDGADAHPFMTVPFNGGVMDILYVAHEMGHVVSNYLASKNQNILTSDASMMLQESFSQLGEALAEKEMMKRATNENDRLRVEYSFLYKEADAVNMLPYIRFEEAVYDRLAQTGASLGYEELNDIYKHHVPLAGNGAPQLHQLAHFFNMLSQNPHNLAVYPVTKIMAEVMEEARLKEPEKFARDYQHIMEQGAHASISELWDTLITPDREKQKQLMGERIEKLGARLESLRTRLEALPDLPKPKPAEPTAAEDASAKDDGAQAQQAAVAAAAGTSTTIGAVLGSHTSMLAKSGGRVETEKADSRLAARDGWSQTVKATPEAEQSTYRG